jgi:hypothetical protein
MVHKTDLEEMQTHTLEHYFSTIIQMVDEGHKDIAQQMINNLSKGQKQDMIDFMEKHIEINPPIDVFETKQWIESRLA